MLEIRKCSIADIFNSKWLLDEYACESATAGLPFPAAKEKMYQQLEENGSLCAFGAFLDVALIGFITVLTSVLPHYGIVVPVSESFFVTKDHRKTGAGLKLLREAEKHVKLLNAPGLLVSAPFGSDLALVLPGVGYEETHQVFFRRFCA